MFALGQKLFVAGSALFTKYPGYVKEINNMSVTIEREDGKVGTYSFSRVKGLIIEGDDDN